MKGNVLILTITRMLLYFTGRLVTPYFSLYVLALGGSAAVIGFSASLASLATVFVYPVAGYLADRRGRVKIIAAAYYIRSLENVFYFLANSWPILAIGKFTRGLGDFQAPAMGAIMADSLPPKRRGIGFASMNALPQATAILAPYIAGYVITRYDITQGIRYLCVVAAVGCILVATIRLKLLKETIKETSGETPIRNVASLLKTSYKNTWEAIKWMPKNLRSLAFVMTVTLFVGAMAGPFWVVYAVPGIQLSALDWGFVLFIVGLMSTALAIPAGAIVDRFGKRKVIIVALTLSLFPVFFFTYCRTFIQTLIALALITAVSMFLNPACQALVADIVPKERRGRIGAAFGRGSIGIRVTVVTAGFVPAIFSMLGSLIGGFIYAFNSTYPWLLLSITLFISLIITIFFVKEPEKVEI
jgi:MFS family permease